MRGSPFSRARAMMAAISHMLAEGIPMSAINVGPYVSRGKGQGKPARNFLRGAANNKYTPHQGKQECARRAARMGG